MTLYRSVTHIESDVSVPNCCGHPQFRSSACGTTIHPNRLIFLSLGGLCCNAVSVFVGPVWLRFLLSLCYLGELHMAAFLAPIQPSYSSLHHSCSASPWLCYTMSSCGAVWSETSAPLLLQNPLITWFCLCLAFFRSRQYEKKSQKHTNSVQMTTEEIQLQETHSPPTLPWAHSGLCCMQSRMGGWAWCVLRPINNYSTAWESSQHLLLPRFPSYCRGCHAGICTQHLDSPPSHNWEAPAHFWSPVRKLKLSHVWGSRTVKSLAGRVSGLRVSDPGWPQTYAIRPGGCTETTQRYLAPTSWITHTVCFTAELVPHLWAWSIPVRCR